MPCAPLSRTEYVFQGILKANDAAATHFLMADPPGTLGALASRGYRAAQLDGGIVAGKIYLGAYAYRFGASGLTFYDNPVTEFFSLDAARKSCMLVIALGESPRLKPDDRAPRRKEQRLPAERKARASQRACTSFGCPCRCRERAFVPSSSESPEAGPGLTTAVRETLPKG